MEQEYTYLLELLKAFLRNQEPRKGEDVNWNRLIQLAQIHCVTGILGYMTMKYPVCPHPEQQEALRRICLETIALYARRGAAMEALSAALEQARIPHILIKGYVLRECYPVPELRTYGDIDLVIRPEDRADCHARMTGWGFRTETDWEPVYSYVREQEFYEIHTELMEVELSDRAEYRAYFRNLWDNTTGQPAFRRRLTLEFHFLYLLTHIAKHIRSAGAGVRMYLDVGAYILHWGKQMDWAWIEAELRKLSLWTFACTVFACVRDWFGVESPLPIPPMDAQILAEFREFTMEAGVFGHYRREDGVNVLKNEAAAPEERVKVLTHRLFPAAKEIENRYTYLHDRPWLLPVAWVHRLVKTRMGWANHAREASVILSADTREINRLRQMMRQIGL